jgi:nicotinamidase-related amidase
MKTALLVIDMQQGLCEGEGRAWASDEVIARINQLADRLREAGVPIVFVQHESTSGYLEHGSREWQLADGLQVQPGDLRVRKRTPDAFLNTDLEALLKARGMEAVIVCGMHTEFCIDTTTRRALALGYPVTLAADAHTSAGNAVLSAPQVIAHHNATLTNISSFGPRVSAVPSTEIGR